MSQPIWKFVTNLGDEQPLEYGGYFIFKDLTGVYPPEGELLVLHTKDKYEIRRFILEPCTFVDGVLSDNKFHRDKPSWFADRIDALASFVGLETKELIDMFVSGTIQERAMAWQAVGDYFGFDNLDSYPLLLGREEAEQRYASLADTVKI